jgi:flagellar protein FlaG
MDIILNSNKVPNGGIITGDTLVSPTVPTKMVIKTGPSPNEFSDPVYINLLHKDKFSLSISEEAVVKAIEKANKSIMGVSKKFEYSVHKSSGDIIVKVLNAETNEVLKEFPSEKLLDLLDKLQEMIGLIIDEKR